MSARAAWRLETLGYTDVNRYVAGKVDWLANGLPGEGQFASEPRIGARDVARAKYVSAECHRGRDGPNTWPKLA